MRRLWGLGMMGMGVLGVLWLALRPNPQVAALLAPCAAPFQLVGVSPAWVIDTLGNIVIFVPLGAGAAWLLWMRSKRCWLGGMLTGLGLSLFIEVLQVFSPTRVVSWRDVGLNTLGAALGAGGGCLAFRRYGRKAG